MLAQRLRRWPNIKPSLFQCLLSAGTNHDHHNICVSACVDGYHGENCVHECGRCSPGTWCDKSSGVCEDGCEGNWDGDYCDGESPLTLALPATP